ncbi:MAG: tRNA(His) guanylyltransferase Thg1 family protein [Vulcanimicrobiota bacterium]
MRFNELDARMRSLEYFHQVKVPPGCWTVLRLDGRGFSRFTAERFDKPFDARFREAMVTTAERLMQEFPVVYGYTESDEISLLLVRDWDFFDRELEKVISLSAATASACFSLAVGCEATFDSRVWMAAETETVVDYFRWRQADAARCALNGWAYWVLRGEGLNARQATARLAGASRADKNELLHQRGVNFNEVPLWQRRGTGLGWESYDKPGFNPLTGQAVTAQRRRLRRYDDLPMKEGYAEFIRELIA